MSPFADQIPSTTCSFRSIPVAAVHQLLNRKPCVNGVKAIQEVGTDTTRKSDASVQERDCSLTFRTEASNTTGFKIMIIDGAG
jgi:hypothetical protein